MANESPDITIRHSTLPLFFEAGGIVEQFMRIWNSGNFGIRAILIRDSGHKEHICPG